MGKRLETVCFFATVAIVLALVMSILTFAKVRAAAQETGSAPGAPSRFADSAPPSPSALGIEFIKNSTSSLVVERNGKRYLIDLVSHSIREMADAKDPLPAAQSSKLAANLASGSDIFKQKCSSCHGVDGKGFKSINTPDFTNPAVQASLTDQQIVNVITNGKPGTLMPAWRSKLSNEQIQSVQKFIRTLTATQPAASAQTAETTRRKLYTAGDDFLFSLPTGRRLGRHALIVNFTHRFPFTPSFTGRANGGSLLGLDDLALPSFGFRYGITDKLSVSIYRSPSFIARPIQLMGGYHFLDEHNGAPLNATVRLSIQGMNNFSRNYTENLEGIFSRSFSSRAQFYVVPTFSLNNRILFSPVGFLSSDIPNLPGYNTFSLGFGTSVDIRPTVAIVAEVIPTLVNGRPLDIHRPAFSLGIQKKIWRHSFTLGWTTSPGTTVAQRAGTRASFLGDPEADKFGGLTIGFDISRQLR